MGDTDYVPEFDFRKRRPSAGEQSPVGRTFSARFPTQKDAESVKDAIRKNRDVALYFYHETPTASEQRELIVYACPQGELAKRISAYFGKSLALCGKNSAHNYMPHCSLTSFFKSKSATIGVYAAILESAMEDAGRPPEHAVEVIGMRLGSAVHKLILRSGWLEGLMRRFVQTARSEIEGCDVTLKHGLHLSLAYHFNPDHRSILERLANDLIDPSAPVGWALRLYERHADNTWTCHWSRSL
jgi:ubiquitin-associated SH3 domain-containing protein